MMRRLKLCHCIYRLPLLMVQRKDLDLVCHRIYPKLQDADFLGGHCFHKTLGTNTVQQRKVQR